MNKIPDSFAPSPQVDVMWHIRNPNAPPPPSKTFDTQKPVQPDPYQIDHETNKILFLLFKGSKLFFFIALGPPYLLFIKFPRGLKRFSFPLIKQAHKNLSDAFKKHYAKIKATLQGLTDRTSPYLRRFNQAISKGAHNLKTALSNFTYNQTTAVKAEINRYLRPTLEMAKSLSTMLTKLSASSLKNTQILAAKLVSFKDGLKGFSIPKVISNGKNRLGNAFSQANEVLQVTWSRLKESSERVKSLFSKKLEEAKNNLNKLKNWPGEQSKKLRKRTEVIGEHIAKVVSSVVTTVRETFIQPMHTVVALMQHPYFAALAMASTARGVMERSVQSVLRSLNEKLQLAKVVILRSGSALLMPFKRGFGFVQRQVQNVLKKMQKRGQHLVQKFYEQRHKAKKRFMDGVQKLRVKVAVLYNLFKRFLSKIFYGLKLFWTWVRLMSSFAAFLIKQLFREVIESFR